MLLRIVLLCVKRCKKSVVDTTTDPVLSLPSLSSVYYSGPDLVEVVLKINACVSGGVEAVTGDD